MSNKIKLDKKFQRKVEEIKKKMNEPEAPPIIDQLSAFNVINKFGHMLDQGWFIDPDSRKMTCSQGIDWRREWMFVNSDPKRCCNLYQEIFKACNFIPEKCLNCWKVVVKMHTVQQLWDLWQWQEQWVKGHEHKDRFCKCGPEKRVYVRSKYGAYFYCDSKQEGLLRKEEVKAELSKLFGHIGKFEDGLVEVTLKRGCTEMELGTCSSTEYVKSDFERYCEERIMAFIDRPKVNPRLPKELAEYVLLQWFKYAWSINDMTVKQFNGGKDLYGSCTTY